MFRINEIQKYNIITLLEPLLIEVKYCIGIVGIVSSEWVFIPSLLSLSNRYLKHTFLTFHRILYNFTVMQYDKRTSSNDPPPPQQLPQKLSWVIVFSIGFCIRHVVLPFRLKAYSFIIFIRLWFICFINNSLIAEGWLFFMIFRNLFCVPQNY